jgi:hypothetical protein
MSSVMPGHVPGIHVFLLFIAVKDVDGRDKPGHDAVSRFVLARATPHSPLSKFSAPEMSALPGASSMLSVFTTPSSTTMA